MVLLKLLSAHTSPCYRKHMYLVRVVKECRTKKVSNKCSIFNILNYDKETERKHILFGRYVCEQLMGIKMLWQWANQWFCDTGSFFNYD